ncbi:DUF3263 domain-containing protein [Actinopolymorpha sp. NPDC004070]|uniref:DUF3263 domain-containing protein n=1 Tax=Actinopolymorpha sp. NPDC004070 TaxID=3154548 RepID=UPI0033B980EB
MDAAMEPAPKIAAGLSDGSPTESTTESTIESTDLDSRATSGLCERDQQIISFERQWWKYAGAKEQAIRDQFGMSATRYYQVLNALIDRPEALAFDPLLVKRLRRLRSSRQRARAARRLGVDG